MRRWPGDETDEAGKRGDSEKRRQVGEGSNTGSRQEMIQAEEKTGRSRDRWKRARREKSYAGEEGFRTDRLGGRQVTYILLDCRITYRTVLWRNV